MKLGATLRLCMMDNWCFTADVLRSGLSSLLALGLCFCFFSCDDSSSLDATLTGTVTEVGSNSKAIANVLVSVTSLGTNESTSVSTNQDGVYSVRESLQAGEDYSIRFNAQGYDELVIRETISAGLNRRDVQLTVLSTCTDNEQNGDETGIDCGGSCPSSCVPAPVPPNCTDNEQNGDETGIDCGGSCPSTCVPAPVPPTNCTDNEQNGDETGIDCGGSCPSTCVPAPVPPTNCTDNEQNGDETGIDCGGSCPNTCTTFSCTDNEQNGDETGVDCGGSCPDACPTCTDNEQNGDETGVDCGGSCPDTCPTCTDNEQNGDETGVDCGGSCPDTCPPPASELTVTIEPTKNIHFSWTSVPSVQTYRLMELADSTSTARQVGVDFPATKLRLELSVPLYARFGSRYYLESCNAQGCSTSNEVILGSELSDAIGYVKASNSENGDVFGSSVALSADGRYLAVGATSEDSDSRDINGNQGNSTNPQGNNYGAVYLYFFDGNVWALQAYIKASNADPRDAFGRSVALNFDGSILAVGSTAESSNSANDPDNNSTATSGAVYVFERSETTWRQQAYIKSQTIKSLGFFGVSVALDANGETLAVGETRTSLTLNNGAIVQDAGAAYIYRRSGQRWTFEDIVSAASPTGFDNFGITLSLNQDGSILAVGAPGEDGNAQAINPSSVNDFAEGAGAAFVFQRQERGRWLQQAYIKARNTEEGDLLGTSVSLNGSGDLLAVGATGEDGPSNTEENSGAVYVFRRQGIAWSQDAYIRGDNTDTRDSFGVSLAISTNGGIDRIFVGASFEDSTSTGINSRFVDSGSGHGAVYTFTRTNNSTWTQESYLKPNDIDAIDNFGGTVSASADGRVLAVGASGEDGSGRNVNSSEINNNARDSGAVYLY